MGLAKRVKIYKKIEALRKRPLIVYVTAARGGIDAQIGADVVPEVVAQLRALPEDATELDLFLVSNGGDGTVAWRIVSLIRERVKKFSVIVPQAAFSAATLIALGADEIIMHPYGNLGPTDAQITNRNKNIQFGSEDLAAFLKFAREEVGVTDQQPLMELFKNVSQEVGYVGIGVAARSAQLTMTMAEKLLCLHMTTDTQSQKAKVISQALNTKFFHHGYPISRSEAQHIGLPVAKSDTTLEGLIWDTWLDIEEELELRQPFNPLAVLRNDTAASALFQPVPQLPAAAQPVVVPGSSFKIVAAIAESARSATRSVTEGEIFAMRLPDLKINYSVMTYSSGWVDETLPDGGGVAQPAKARKKSAAKKGSRK